MQVSNLCFAFGQIYYREIMKKTKNIKDYQIFGMVYFGAVLITSLATILTVELSALEITQNQLFALLYLGIIASGIGFFLWNFGARTVSGGTLAVMNNLKIPLAVTVSLLFFNEQIHIIKLLVGGTIVFIALIISEKSS
jgi:drug/metabolite transporter (DMT)-like permease